MKESFTVELKKVQRASGWRAASVWHYVQHIETAEWIANNHSIKRGSKFEYTAVVMTRDIIVKQSDDSGYGPLKVGESKEGRMIYTPEWIAHTTVSSEVDGIVYKTTL